MFRVLGSIEALNERMNLNLTHHDINWIYNLQHLKGQGYYLKSRQSKVRLIQYLPISNKGLMWEPKMCRLAWKLLGMLGNVIWKLGGTLLPWLHSL